MNVNDLEKNLDNLIIDGLIKEAEQDNADFEAALRKMSDEEFEGLIYEPAYAKVVPQPFAAKKSKWQVLRPWFTSAVAAAAVVLIVLVQNINSMNSKLCESALYASQSYMTPSKGGFDIATASVEEVETELPNLTTRYSSCIDELKRSRTHFSPDLQEAGWDLTLAYLKLHKKNDAVKILKVLSEQYKGSPFGDHCQKMLNQL